MMHTKYICFRACVRQCIMIGLLACVFVCCMRWALGPWGFRVCVSVRFWGMEMHTTQRQVGAIERKMPRPS